MASLTLTHMPSVPASTFVSRSPPSSRPLRELRLAILPTANQFLVYRVTMSDVEYASYINGQSLVPSGLSQLRQRRAANAKRLAGIY
jgi:hypothetical protein